MGESYLGSFRLNRSPPTHWVPLTPTHWWHGNKDEVAVVTPLWRTEWGFISICCPAFYFLAPLPLVSSFLSELSIVLLGLILYSLVNQKGIKFIKVFGSQEENEMEKGYSEYYILKVVFWGVCLRLLRQVHWFSLFWNIH